MCYLGLVSVLVSDVGDSDHFTTGSGVLVRALDDNSLGFLNKKENYLYLKI